MSRKKAVAKHFCVKKLLIKCWWDWHVDTTSDRFHQHFMSSFFVRKCLTRLCFNYWLALYFFGKRIPVQKMLIKCWWYWLLPSISSTFYVCIFCMKFCAPKITKLKWTVTRESCGICFCTKKVLIKCWWNWLLVAKNDDYLLMITNETHFRYKPSFKSWILREKSKKKEKVQVRNSRNLSTQKSKS